MPAGAALALAGICCFRFIVLLRSPVGAAPAEHLIDRDLEMMSGGRCGNGSPEDRFVRNILAVKRLGVVRILVNLIAREIYASEQSFTAGVGQELGIRQFRRRRLRVTTYGTSRGCNVTPQLHLILE